MSDHLSRFRAARLRLLAALPGAIAAAALALGLGLAPAVAEETPTSEAQATEAVKAEAVKRIMAGREFTLSESSDPAVCTPLLEDFQAQRGIEYVEPVARAERYRDPAFEPYRAMCPGWEFNRWHYSQIISALDDMNLPEDQRQESLEATGKHYFGTRNFKLYHLDLDGNPANGEEYVFYAERYYLRSSAVPWYLRIEKIPGQVDWNDILRPEEVPDDAEFVDGGYTVLDFANCKRMHRVQIYDPYDYLEGRPLANHTGIIKHRGRYYIFELFESDHLPGKDVYGLTTFTFNGDYFEKPCTFWQKVKEP